MTEQEVVSLRNLGRGAAIEKFDDELARVLENILDPNTGLDMREVVLRVKMKPDEKRGLAEVEIRCESKLAPPCNVSTQVFVGRRGKTAVAFENDPKQSKLFDAPVPEPMRAIKGGAK